MKAPVWVFWLLLSLILCQGTGGYKSGHALLREDSRLFPSFSLSIPHSTQRGASIIVIRISEDQGLDVSGNATNSIVRRLDTDCNPSNLQPTLPNGPYFCGFPDQNKYNMVNRAYLDALTLAHAAVTVLQRCDQSPSLTRYFDVDTPGVREQMIKIVLALLGRLGGGADEFRDPGFEYEVWYQEPPEGRQRFKTCDSPGGYGYTIWDESDSRKVYTVMCPLAFHLYQASLGSLTCNDLRDKAGKYMMCPGSMLLHELMHWKRLTMAHAGIEIDDWNRLKDSDVNPPDGYGPRNAETLQRLGKDPVLNADSYTWFALEAYWSEKCGRIFGDQVEVDDHVIGPDDIFGPDGPDNGGVSYPPSPP